MSEKAKFKVSAKMIFKIIWIVLAITLWTIGCVMFAKAQQDKFLYWFYWGALCSICIIGTVLKGASKQGRIGRAKGANDYTASVSGNTVTVENHPLRGAIIGFIGGLLGGILAGPIVLIIYMIKNIIELVKLIKTAKVA